MLAQRSQFDPTVGLCFEQAECDKWDCTDAALLSMTGEGAPASTTCPGADGAVDPENPDPLAPDPDDPLAPDPNDPLAPDPNDPLAPDPADPTDPDIILEASLKGTNNGDYDPENELLGYDENNPLTMKW